MLAAFLLKIPDSSTKCDLCCVMIQVYDAQQALQTKLCVSNVMKVLLLSSMSTAIKCATLSNNHSQLYATPVITETKTKMEKMAKSF